jgi:hypothetical protein
MCKGKTASMAWVGNTMSCIATQGEIGSTTDHDWRHDGHNKRVAELKSQGFVNIHDCTDDQLVAMSSIHKCHTDIQEFRRAMSNIDGHSDYKMIDVFGIPAINKEDRRMMELEYYMSKADTIKGTRDEVKFKEVWLGECCVM